MVLENGSWFWLDLDAGFVLKCARASHFMSSNGLSFTNAMDAVDAEWEVNARNDF